MHDSKKIRLIATRKGDSGETDLLYGKRVSKADPQIEAAGTLDELSSALAFAKSLAKTESEQRQLERFQIDLIALSGEISTPAESVERYLNSKFSKISSEQLERLDRELEKAERTAPRPKDWALPGSTQLEAALEIARSHARRAERRIIFLKEN